MSEFVDTPLGEVITLQNDKRAQLKSSDYLKSGLLPIIDQSAKFICGYTNDSEKKYSKPLPVIVFGDHTLNTKFVDFDFAVGADGTQIIRTRNPSHDQKYLYYLIDRETHIMGSEGYKRHLKILKERVIPFLQSLPEQKKIASILTSVDDVIETTQRQIDKLQDLKKATMNELLSKGIGHTEFKDSELGRIPKSWAVVSIGDACTFVTSGSRGWSQYYSTNGAIFVRIGNLTRDNINFKFDDIVRVSPPDGGEGTRTNVVCGDVLISITADLGVIAVANEKLGNAYVNQHVCLARFDDEPSLNPRWVGHYLSGHQGQDQFVKKNDSGAKAGLNLPTIRSIKFPVPPMNEQTKIVRIIDQFDDGLFKIRRKLNQTQSLKKSLMQDLLTGKVRVQVN